jgi:2-phospho-L-lactate guanylyltransferase
VNAWAVVPAKGFARAKTRLEPALDAPSRVAVARAMLEHVLGVLHGSRGIDGVMVVTDDDQVEAMARARGVLVVRDAGEPPLRIAVDTGLTAVRKRAQTAALVIMADLPLVRADDVERLLAALDGADVVIAPDARGSGTNAIGFARDVTMQTEFGMGDSFAAHRRGADDRGLRTTVHIAPGTAYDVDLPDDLVVMGNLMPEGVSRAVARSGSADLGRAAHSFQSASRRR